MSLLGHVCKLCKDEPLRKLPHLSSGCRVAVELIWSCMDHHPSFHVLTRTISARGSDSVNNLRVILKERKWSEKGQTPFSDQDGMSEQSHPIRDLRGQRSPEMAASLSAF
jgi:hypothetical protein